MRLCQTLAQSDALHVGQHHQNCDALKAVYHLLKPNAYKFFVRNKNEAIFEINFTKVWIMRRQKSLGSPF